MSKFGDRLAQVFEGKKQVEIAEMLGVTHTAVRNYLGGRVPDIDKLQLISKITGCDLHWLLTGEEKAAKKQTVSLPDPSFEDVFERRVREIVRDELGRQTATETQELGTIDEFNIDSAIEKWNDPQAIMGAWFRSEGHSMPADYGVIFFTGWEMFTNEEKKSAVIEAKKAIDRNRPKTVGPMRKRK